MSILDYIEDEEITLSDDVYYHAFPYRQNEFINMITEGIKAPILIGERSRGNNGFFYVSLSKDENKKNSAYEIMKHMPMLVIDGRLSTVKVKYYLNNRFNYWWATNLPIPLRESEYEDEYQKLLRIDPKYFLAIEYNLAYNLNRFGKIDEDLSNITKMIIDLENQGVDLPIIDGSNKKRINKEKVLKL